ncbi:MAG TPA: DNA helicase II [Crenotrichaceae bacterium]|nr:DNA helicase II [Crenotrichaceae bacterium]
MDITPLIDPLNDAQRTAVTAPFQSALVLAGAGSGKTRVLVHRIGWMIQVENLPAYSILAVTFTNKAAREMLGRVESLMQQDASAGMWIGTFHGLAHRFLRRHSAAANLPDTFQVLDSDDQQRLIKRIIRSAELDETRYPPKQIQWYINAHKDEGRRAAHVQTDGTFWETMQQIYKTYEDLCQRSGLVDFAELLLRCLETLRDTPELLDQYRNRFRYVLVDEFQDTNTIQYAWLKLLTQGQNNLFVVGDDDQSIYGWRGARIENIHSFQSDYPDHRLIRLEQNYRSTANILNAANALIANNENRMGKELWTDDKDGDPITVYDAFNEQDEAYFVVNRIKQWVAEGNLREQAAILYRSNAQSRLFEERLVSAAIPYRVYGGLRFFERAEIKTALAYLRLIANRHDDASFERVVNLPTRGIGARSMDAVREIAKAQKCSLWDSTRMLCRDGGLSARAVNALKAFLELIENHAIAADSMPLHDQVRLVIEKSGLIAHYQKEGQEKGATRIDNLKELVNAARQFSNEAEIDAENMKELDLFLSHAALEAGDAQGDTDEDCVQLMTLHSAKGLEFDLVFLVGMEEGLFPGQKSLEEIGRLEEERRLCYVGMTRARQQLVICHAESRRLYGREHRSEASRFLREIPSQYLQEIRMQGQVSRPVTAYGNHDKTKTNRDNGDSTSGFMLGQQVNHSKFGTGIILQQEGDGNHARVQINFESAGTKWLVLAYANLTAVS